jgi:hypothetical protein
MFRRNMSPPFSGSKNKPSKKLKKAEPCIPPAFYVGFLFYLLFDPEYEGDIFLRNIGWLSMDDTAVYSIRQNSCQFVGISIILYFNTILLDKYSLVPFKIYILLSLMIIPIRFLLHRWLVHQWIRFRVKVPYTCERYMYMYVMGCHK